MRVLSIFILTIVWNNNASIVPTNILPMSIIVDVDKGIVLQHIGIYSEKLEESLFHIIIPYNNLCNDSPDSTACDYVRSNKPNIIEVGTVIPSNEVSTSYDKKNVSAFIYADIRRIFSYHKMNKVIEKTRSFIFFVDNSFYISPNTVESSTKTPSHAVNTNRPTLEYRPINPATIALDHVLNKKIGYDFLSSEQTDEFLSLTMPSVDWNLNKKRPKENLNILTHMIVGQSVHALKSCSIDQNENFENSQSCLVVSTIFRRIPKESSSIYQIYRLISLPVLFNGEKYIYSDLPNVIGFNNMEKEIVLWNDDKASSDCIFSKIVQCRNHPMNIPIDTLPCLNELFSSEFTSSVSSCSVTKSKLNQGDILNIHDNIWYIYPVEQSLSCEYPSLSSGLTDVITITEPMIVSLPCEKPVQCGSNHLPSASCSNTTIVSKSNRNYTINSQIITAIRFNTIINRLVSIYKTAAKKNLIELQNEIDTTVPLIEKFLEEFPVFSVPIAAFIVILVALFIRRRDRKKDHNQLEELKTEMNRIRRDLPQQI